MTKVTLLKVLREFTLKETADLIMPMAMQKGDEKQEYRAANVYLMSLPNVSKTERKVPYALHQILPGKDIQPEGKQIQSSVEVRTIFTVCSPYMEEDGEFIPDKQEGGMILLNFMERLRISLLKTVVIGRQFQLDLEDGLEAVPYPDTQETALKPYCAGEMRSRWTLPAIEREV